MTIKEAIEKRIRWLRLPEWAAGTYIELPPMEGKSYDYDSWVIIADMFSGITRIRLYAVLEDPTDRWEKVTKSEISEFREKAGEYGIFLLSCYFKEEAT